MARVSEEFMNLCKYVANKPDKATLDYDTVERETGIDMSQESGNRGKLARAIMKAGRRALAFPGLGYELDGVDNTEIIVDKAGQRVYRQIKRSSRTTKIVLKRHYAELPDDAQSRMKVISQTYNILERKTTYFEEVDIKTIKEVPPPDLEARK